MVTIGTGRSWLIWFRIAATVEVFPEPDGPLTSTSPLGENFLEILAGSAAAPRAQRDAVLKSKEPTSFSDIADKINELTPAANDAVPLRKAAAKKTPAKKAAVKKTAVKVVAKKTVAKKAAAKKTRKAA